MSPSRSRARGPSSTASGLGRNAYQHGNETFSEGEEEKVVVVNAGILNCMYPAGKFPMKAEYLLRLTQRVHHPVSEHLPTGYRRNRNEVTAPKFPPPPRTPQKRSAFSVALAVRNSPSAVTISTDKRLSQAKPYCDDPPSRGGVDALCETASRRPPGRSSNRLGLDAAGLIFIHRILGRSSPPCHLTIQQRQGGLVARRSCGSHCLEPEGGDDTCRSNVARSWVRNQMRIEQKHCGGRRHA